MEDKQTCTVCGIKGALKQALEVDTDNFLKSRFFKSIIDCVMVK